jgi:hypothetical protein
MKLLSLFLLSLVSAALYSQDFRKGFIITPQNDTLRGYVSYREALRAHRVCSFKATSNHDVVKYEPTQLKGYGFDDNANFISKLAEVRDSVYEQVFLEVLVSGKVTLYKYDYFYFLEKDDGKLHRLIVKEVARERDGTTYIGKSTHHIGVVKVMLGDCEALRPSLEKFELNEKTISRFVGRYNQCFGGTAVVYKEKKSWFKAEIGILGGVSLSTLEVTSENDWNDYLTSPYHKSTAPVGGVSFLLSSPRLNERFGFLGEAQFVKSSYYSFSQIGSGSSIQRNYISITVSQVRIPIAVRYTFTGKKISPFVDAGFSTILNTRSSGSTTSELYSQYSHTVLLSEPVPLQLRNHQTGVWGGLGMVFPIHPKWNGFIEFRYEKASSIVEGGIRVPGDLTSSVTNLQLILGLRTK